WDAASNGVGPRFSGRARPALPDLWSSHADRPPALDQSLGRTFHEALHAMNLTLVLWGCCAAALSGLPGLFMDRRQKNGQVLATTGGEDRAACRSGWIYLGATHLGTICLIFLFTFLRKTTGSTALDQIGDERITSPAISIVFVMTLLGFGFKAGLMPRHVWL